MYNIQINEAYKMATIKKAETKTKKTVKPKAKAKTKSEKPWVKVLDMNVNPENPRNGFFELDWNDEFVNMLKQNGYEGQSDTEIVDKWFQTLCRTIGSEQEVNVEGAGYININRTPDGKTEVS